MILTQAQAEAVYSAMCALNNVCAKMKAEMRSSDKKQYVEVQQTGERVYVSQYTGGRVSGTELHADQTAFAAAYGLN